MLSTRRIALSTIIWEETYTAQHGAREPVYAEVKVFVGWYMGLIDDGCLFLI